MNGEHQIGPGGRLAIILFNLGGPESPAAVQPFLFNLFNDPAIIGAPAPIRKALAGWMSRRRAPVARAIYNQIGGGSPLLAQTEAQAQALQRRLGERGTAARVFICMRYWHPMSDETARAVASWAPDRIVLLPLYPQFSTTTTGSSAVDWHRAAAAAGLVAPTHMVCCYPAERGFIAAVSRLLRDSLARMPAGGRARVLFSAHGLPKRVIARGDPYQWQVKMSVKMLISAWQGPPFEHVVCYQSRVGPLAWIGPSTEAEIARAVSDGVGIILVPIAFVSEHSETLVELDIEYRHKAEKLGVAFYYRVPTVMTAPEFIDGLADLVIDGLNRARPLCPWGGLRFCAYSFSGCPCPAGSPRPEKESECGRIPVD